MYLRYVLLDLDEIFASKCRIFASKCRIFAHQNFARANFCYQTASCPTTSLILLAIGAPEFDQKL